MKAILFDLDGTLRDMQTSSLMVSGLTDTW